LRANSGHLGFARRLIDRAITWLLFNICLDPAAMVIIRLPSVPYDLFLEVPRKISPLLRALYEPLSQVLAFGERSSRFKLASTGPAGFAKRLQQVGN